MDNVKSTEFSHGHDYFIANIEDGELAMRPHCSCGNFLEDQYFCEICKKQCLCTHIFCKDEATMKMVEEFISNAPSFKQFEVSILPE